jgi:hypothetical protein
LVGVPEPFAGLVAGEGTASAGQRCLSRSGRVRLLEQVSLAEPELHDRDQGNDP